MLFTINEIKGFLKTQKSIDAALTNISEQAIIDCIPVDDFDSLNYVKNDVNLLKYEAHIGMTKRKEEQLTLYMNTNGKKGRTWMACAPRWIDESQVDTKYEISYWVNYGDGNTYGRFTVELIQKWFDNPDIKLHQLGGTKER